MTDDDIAKARETIAAGQRSRDASWFTPPYWNGLLSGWSAALDEVVKLQTDCRKWQVLGRQASEVLERLAALAAAGKASA